MKLLKKINHNNIKNLINKFKWILKQSKPIIIFIVMITLINSLISFSNVYNAIVSKSLIDSAINGQTHEVFKWLFIMALIIILNMVCSPITSLISTHASTKLTQNIQRNLYEHLEYSDWLTQSKYHSINLLTRITSDVDTIISMLLKTIPSVITFTLTLIASFYTLIYLASSIAIVAIVIGPAIVIISKIFSKRLKLIYKQVQEADIKYKSFIQESLQNIMIVKTFCMEKVNLEKIKNIQKNNYSLSMKNTKLLSLTSFSIDSCSSAAYFTIFCWGALNISKGSYTYGTFTAMLQLYSQIQYPISSLAHLFPSIISSLAAAERLMELENFPLEKYSQDSTIAFNAPTINFRNVSFKYNDASTVIDNISLQINPGETIALIGSSGEGKTTLIRLLLSLIQPSKGEISFYEDNISQVINRNHRTLISYVPQGNTLFSGTIEENLKYGNTNASHNEILDSLKKSCCFDFINDLPSGIHTVIGEKGLGLSEGQSQRIAIARSLLRKKPILILDEATSSLDPETEIKILKEIKNLSHKPTCIIITHRPSALNICSAIYKLKNGTLINIEKDTLLEIANELV